MRWLALGLPVLAALFISGCEPASTVESTTIVQTAAAAELTTQESPDLCAQTVLLEGQPHPRIGNELKAGEMAPDVPLVANNLSVMHLSKYHGNVLVLSAVPSLDTPVCSTETRKFDELAAQLGNGVKVLTISMDLPFAQKRWCAEAGIKNVETLSDHRWAAFGRAYGVLIPDVRLLSRAVFVVDKHRRVRYAHRLGDLSKEPDYQEVLGEVEKLQKE